MTEFQESKEPLYYYIDIDLQSRQIIGWGVEPKHEVKVSLSSGGHRVFLSKGQYNKLEKKLSEIHGN